MKKKSYINKGFLIIILCLVVLFSGVVVEAQNLNNLLQEEEKTLDEETIKKLEEVLSIIDTYYVEETSEEELIENALKGMVGELDDFSLYMNEDEFDEQEFQMEGEYGGIGLRVMTIEDELTIVSPFKDTPGDRAGLQAGDVIKEVNGKPTSEMTQEKAVEIMRGEPGTSVELLISRKEEEEDFSVEIIREEIEIPFVSTEMETERIGYISITQFMEDVGTDVEAEIEKLQDEGAEALI
ncbi:MAG: S41 family peptidase, partial [Bacillota bacterium]